MGKSNKTITKCCPFCELQVAVACKTCPGCKHSFYNAKRLTLSQSAIIEDSVGPGGRRRTERVKREKPNYYDASEFEKKTKKKRLERNAAEAGRDRNRSNAQPLKKKRKKKISKSAKEQDEDEPCITISSDKARQCSIILAELNRKLFTTTWKPA